MAKKEVSSRAWGVTIVFGLFVFELSQYRKASNDRVRSEKQSDSSNALCLTVSIAKRGDLCSYAVRSSITDSIAYDPFAETRLTSRLS